MTSAVDARPLGLATGDGLAASYELLNSLIYPILSTHSDMDDGTWIPTTPGGWQVATCDLFTVDPIEFPGGNIGQLAAVGCINDLLASGAQIRWVSVGLYLSEHLSRSLLATILTSFRDQLAPLGATVVCGDTKIHQMADPSALISVTAIGEPIGTRRFALTDARPGDTLIVTGALGAHSIAVLSAREGLGFERAVYSDVAALTAPVTELIAADQVHCMRDLTRGGLVGGLWEGAMATGLPWTVNETDVLVDHPVAAAASLLGLDPMALTNEGCMLMAVPAEHVDATLAILREHESTRRATAVGRIGERTDGKPIALVRDEWGTERILPYPAGIGVPRLC